MNTKDTKRGSPLLSWISKKIFGLPVRSTTRDLCEHGRVCHLCPRSRCVGALNDPRDPDISKPRTSSYGACVYLDSGLRMRVTKEQANKLAAQRAAAQQAHLPTDLWLPPGYDEEELQARLKALD